MNQKVTFERKERYDFNDLKTIMDILRSEQGCPWDREQTHESIRSCMIEEAYEVVEAIDTQNAALLREELGDVLFQVMFHSRIEFEKNEFTQDAKDAPAITTNRMKKPSLHPMFLSDNSIFSIRSSCGNSLLPLLRLILNYH